MENNSLLYKVDCVSIAKEIKEDVRHAITKENLDLTLAVVTFDNSEASKVYVRQKSKACEEVGIKFKDYVCPMEFETKNLLQLIYQLNKDENITGILVQLPLPDHIDKDKVIAAIDVKKDVDGFTPWNVAALHLQKPENEYLIPCTPLGIIEIIKRTVGFNKQRVLMIGRSNIVGRPVAELLLQNNCTVTVAHSKSDLTWEDFSNYDIIISAIGKAQHWHQWSNNRNNKLLIDVGMNKKEDNKLCGDFDMRVEAKSPTLFTPVPKGVGVMTIAMLMSNILKAYRLQSNDFIINEDE